VQQQCQHEEREEEREDEEQENRHCYNSMRKKLEKE
jgi:hypothetical protein